MDKVEVVLVRARWHEALVWQVDGAGGRAEKVLRLGALLGKKSILEQVHSLVGRGRGSLVRHDDDGEQVVSVSVSTWTGR